MKTGKRMKFTMVAMFTAMTAIYAVQDTDAAKEDLVVQLNCSAELADLANEMAFQYQQENADVEINVATISENNSDEFLAGGGIALVDKGCLSAVADARWMKLVVGRDVIVPVMNVNHPQKEIILKKGITKEQFASIYKSERQIRWGELLGTNDERVVNAYVPGQKCAKGYLGGFIDAAPGVINAMEVGTSEEMIKKIESDRYSIGFCTLACLAKIEAGGIEAGISLVPVDVDGDGNVEHFEDIYNSYAELSHGIFVGKYPRALYSRIYAVASQKTATEAEVAFIEWMINGSQKALASAGILDIDYSEKASGLAQLYPTSIIVANVPVKASATRNLLIILGALGILTIVFLVFAGRSNKRPVTGGETGNSGNGAFGADTATFPAGLFFDRSHTWAFMEKTGNVRVGLDDFIQHVTGPVSKVMMKSPGERLSRGEALLTIVQQGKQLEIKSPVSGVVIDQNSELQNNARLLNDDPYAAGWVYTVEPASWMAEIKPYFMGDPYGQWLKSEFTRLKDFFATGLKLNGKPEPVLVMQDGGEIRDGVLEDFGPEVWEEFQEKFINIK